MAVPFCSQSRRRVQLTSASTRVSAPNAAMTMANGNALACNSCPTMMPAMDATTCCTKPRSEEAAPACSGKRGERPCHRLRHGKAQADDVDGDRQNERKRIGHASATAATMATPPAHSAAPPHTMVRSRPSAVTSFAASSVPTRYPERGRGECKAEHQRRKPIDVL